MDNIEFTNDARFRILLAKEIMTKIQEKIGHEHEEWHVYTFKKDKENPDPDRFRVHKTKKNILPFGADRLTLGQCFNIYIREDKERITVRDIQVRETPGIGEEYPLSRILGMDSFNGTNIEDWIIRFEK